MTENTQSYPESLAVLRERRSIRTFADQPLKDGDLEQILLATRQAPTSINAHGVSLVVVQDKERKRAIAKLTGDQQHIDDAAAIVVFVGDLYRTGLAGEKHGIPQRIHESAEGMLVAAVDAGIAMTTFQTAAHSLGYGTTAIGGIRRNPEEIIKLLDLPEHTFPIVGSTIGVPAADHGTPVKPRVPLSGYAMMETYDREAVRDAMDTYDEQLKAHYDARKDQGLTWSEMTSKFYSFIYYPKVARTLTQQGFVFGDGQE